MDEKLKLIKSVICEVVGDRLEKTILFGSRARGEGSSSSDYDILVVLKDELSVREEMEIAKAIRAKLAKHLIPVDVLVASASEVEYLSSRVGNVIRSAVREGVVL